MGGGPKKKRNRKNKSEVSDDVLELDDDSSHLWLSDEIESEATKRKTKFSKAYDETDVCVVGLERIIAVANDDAAEETSLDKIESQLRLSRMYHTKFYESMVAKQVGLSAAQIMQHTAKMDRIDRLYNQLLDKLTDQRKKLLLEDSNNNNSNPMIANSTNIGIEHHGHDMKIKAIEVQKFGGDVRKWPQFKSSFEDCFHNNAHYTKAAKFYHLMAHLVENSEAYNTISGIPRTEANYDIAWKSLCEAYDNERKIVNDIVLSFIDMPSIEEPTRAALIALRNNTNNLLNSLPKYGIAVQHWDPILVPLLIRKMDGESIRLWSLERDQRSIAKLKPLLEFIQKRADGMDAECLVSFNSNSTVVRHHSQTNSNADKSQFVSQKGHFRGAGASFKQQTPASSDSKYVHDPSRISKTTTTCYHCNNKHPLFGCASFGRMSVELRRDRLMTLNVCGKCLRKGHSVDKCRNMRNCPECQGPHNRLLCDKSNGSATALFTTNPGTMITEIDASLLATLTVFVFDSHGNKVKVRAVSDGGSHMCIITNRLVQRLMLKTVKLAIPLEGAGRCNIAAKSIVDVRIAPAENGSSTGEWLRAGVMSVISDKLPSTAFDITEFKHLQGIPLADTHFNQPDDIDMLLSVEFMARIQVEGLRKDKSNECLPIAQNTTFGWVVYGALPKNLKLGSSQCLHVSMCENQTIADNLEKLWKVDEVVQRSLLTDEEKLCQEHFKNSISRATDGRYIVAMPILPNAPKLGSSLKAAIARQLTNERRFKKDPVLKQKYVADIQQFIDMDHIELVPPNEIEKEVGEVYYIPHHAAQSNKFRVVFDGSVKTTSGVALNDILMNGPKLQEALNIIIMQFRMYAIAITTDVTKMYRQVEVPVNQRDLLRIIWRENPDEPFKHYRMKRQTYGLKSSAFCCVGALRQCAVDHKDEFPLASEAVLRCFYVDDGTLGAHFECEAMELYRQLNLMLEKGGFPLAKWATNNQKIQAAIGTTANAVDLDLFNESSVLGIKWSVIDDCFKYRLVEQITEQPPTKRHIIASVARLFDPIGWISPIVVFGKILIQEIWKSACDWDATVPMHIQTKWNEFRCTLVELAKISIPRWIATVPGLKITIHGFSDASSRAYGICFYVRVEHGEHSKCNLLSSKTKVAPLKGMTIPRLELCAALLLAQACEEIRDVHGVDCSKITFWIDSSIVIHWLSKCPAGMKTFVANRIAEAQDLSKGVQWRHVRTHDNPADLASRGVLANELVNNSLWFNGPAWLCEAEDKWPVSDFVVDRQVEEATASESKSKQILSVIKRVITPRIETRSGLLLDVCGTMMKLVRITARVLRFIDAVRRKVRYDSKTISKDEYLKAQALWIRYHQVKWYANELKSLKDAKEKGNVPGGMKCESSLLKMTPFIDGEEIMRVGGRIKRSSMPFDTKHPIILHNQCRLVHLLALEAHHRTLHGGTQQSLQYIRQRFWSSNLRKTIKRIALKCVKCFRQRKEIANQLMGDLPSTRVTSGHPFESVGVDYAGPVTIKERSGRCKKTYKAYIAVFVCMKTKAVYLDLVTDLTTDAFIACLTRLISLRGSVREIYSDNASTFHGADNELKAIFEHWQQLSKCDCMCDIRWTFIAPLSPSQGGLWERAVRSTKHHLRRVIGTQLLTFEEYATVLAHVSACLNSRPIMALDDDASSPEALTPAHLIIGRRLIGPMQYDYVEIPDNRLLRWRLIQKMVQEFWLQWQREFIDHQIERSKWRIEQNNIEKGAVVLIKTDSLPPTHWPLGLVTAVFPGDDGRVRNVEVRVGLGTYTRSIHKIAVLPINDDPSI